MEIHHLAMALKVATILVVDDGDGDDYDDDEVTPVVVVVQADDCCKLRHLLPRYLVTVTVLCPPDLELVVGIPVLTHSMTTIAIIMIDPIDEVQTVIINCNFIIEKSNFFYLKSFSLMEN